MLNLQADMISRCKVALKRGRDSAVVLNSGLVKASGKKGKELGFFITFNVISFKNLQLYFRYIANNCVVQTLENFFKNAGYINVGWSDIYLLIKKSYSASLGFYVFSTNKGLLSDIECYLHKTGGFILFFIG